MVKIRCKRMGRRNRPFYRIGVFDARTRRDGRSIEDLGTYDPMTTDAERVHHLNSERAVHWLNQGAQPSETVASIFKRLEIKKTVVSKRKARSKPKKS